MSQSLRHIAFVMCAAFALLLLAPTPALADDAAEAQARYEEGMESYFAGKYSEAIISFNKAYELDPNPIFLFNMSIAYEKAGNYEEAYEEGLRAKEGGIPDQPAQINNARLPALGTVLRARTVAGRVSGSLPCASDSECRGGTTCDLKTNVCVDPASSDQRSGDAVAGGPFLGIPFSIYGWIGSGLALAGAGLTAVAVIVDIGIGGDIESYEALSEDEKRSAAGNTIADDIEGQQQTGQILLYSGGALIATGAGLIVYDLFFNDGNEHRAATIDVGVAPDGASVQATWRF